MNLRDSAAVVQTGLRAEDVDLGRMLIITIVAAPVVLTGCTASDTASSPVVVVTIEPLAMILAELVGDSAEVVALVPPGASPHTYDLRPSGARAAQRSSALFFVDEGVDGWAARVSAPKKFAVFDMVPESLKKRAMDAPTDNDAQHVYNPHFWTDPLRVPEVLPLLVAALDEADPKAQSTHESMRERFSSDLVRLDEEIEKALRPFEGVNIVVFHPSWAYFLDRYGLETAAILEPFPGKEPTPRYLKEVIDAARAKDVKVIITEPQLPPRPAEIVAEAAGLAIVELDPLGGAEGRTTYAEWLLGIAHTLREALQ